ncbi:MAG: PaaI family thioesterase [Dehalococcoidia bacterium]|nr:PaaI family thioesterase [Dehalococcoidia bacterium]
MADESRKLPDEELHRVFRAAPFVRSVGIKLVTIGPGYCETVLRILPRHLQQNGYVHAGVQATMADHTMGGAATTLAGSQEYILTAEFKINFLRAATGERLRCKSSVLKPGSMLMVVESEVYCDEGDTSRLVSKATATMAVMTRNRKS